MILMIYQCFNFWDTNPINNYYMLKVMRIKDEDMIVIGSAALSNNKIFLRIISMINLIN